MSQSAGPGDARRSVITYALWFRLLYGVLGAGAIALLTLTAQALPRRDIGDILGAAVVWAIFLPFVLATAIAWRPRVVLFEGDSITIVDRVALRRPLRIPRDSVAKVWEDGRSNRVDAVLAPGPTETLGGVAFRFRSPIVVPVRRGPWQFVISRGGYARRVSSQPVDSFLLPCTRRARQGLATCLRSRSWPLEPHWSA